MTNIYAFLLKFGSKVLVKIWGLEKLPAFPFLPADLFPPILDSRKHSFSPLTQKLPFLPNFKLPAFAADSTLTSLKNMVGSLYVGARVFWNLKSELISWWGNRDFVYLFIFAVVGCEKEIVFGSAGKAGSFFTCIKIVINSHQLRPQFQTWRASRRKCFFTVRGLWRGGA